MNYIFFIRVHFFRHFHINVLCTLSFQKNCIRIALPNLELPFGSFVRRAHIESYRITDEKVLNSQFPLSGKSLLSFLYVSERDMSRSATVLNLTHAYVSLTSTLFLHLKPYRKRTFLDYYTDAGFLFLPFLSI